MKSLLVEILGRDYSKLTSFYSEEKMWFKAQDVCKILGLRNTSLAVRGGNVRIGYFGIDQEDIHRLSPHRNATLYISEAGVYKLILTQEQETGGIYNQGSSECEGSTRDHESRRIFWHYELKTRHCSWAEPLPCNHVNLTGINGGCHFALLLTLAINFRIHPLSF